MFFNIHTIRRYFVIIYVDPFLPPNSVWVLSDIGYLRLNTLFLSQNRRVVRQNSFVLRQYLSFCLIL